MELMWIECVFDFCDNNDVYRFVRYFVGILLLIGLELVWKIVIFYFIFLFVMEKLRRVLIDRKGI